MEDRIKFSFTREMRNLSLKQSEYNFRKRHENWIQNNIEEKRNYSDANIDDIQPYTNESYLNSNMNLRMNIEEKEIKVNFVTIENSLAFLYIKNFSDKMKTKFYLKSLRKELCKNSMDSEIFRIMMTSNNNQFFFILAEFLFDFKNSEIQLETLWILNNLCIFCQRFQLNYHFYEIHKILINFMQSENSFSNTGVKNLIVEKFFSLVGNLILYEEDIFHFYIGNNILLYLIKNLNCSVRSLRYVCLLTINNIISAFNKCIDNDHTKINNTKNNIINSLFANNELIYYLKFILNRVDSSKKFDECYEFFWLLNYISIENFDLVLNLFVKDGRILTENVNKIINFIFYDKLHQPAIRILGNLINFNNKFTHEILEIIFKEKNLFSFFSNLLIENSNNTNIDFLIKDVIWLIKNLAFYNPIKIKNILLNSLLIFLNGLFTKIKSDLEINKNILLIFYYLYTSDNFTKFNNCNDQILINFILNNINEFNSDIATRFITIDFLFIYNKLQSKLISNDLFVKIEYFQTNNL